MDVYVSFLVDVSEYVIARNDTAAVVKDEIRDVVFFDKDRRFLVECVEGLVFPLVVYYSAGEGRGIGGRRWVQLELVVDDNI